MNKVSKSSSKSRIEDIKLKPLSPTLRQKKRFIRAKIICSRKLDFKIVSESLIEEMILFLGAIDVGKAGVWVLRDKFDFEKQELVLKCSTGFSEKLIAALALVTSLGGSNVCKIEVVRVSGTLKGVFKV